MDDAVRARRTAREALSDVEPEALRTVIDDRLADASMTPGALALVSARAVAPTVDPDGVADRAAGVQLIYEGLRLTRALTQSEPWYDAAVGSNGYPEEDLPADVEILAADVLVSRGFYLLARTDAADCAVETVRAFGRDQTERRTSDDGEPAALDRNLEADVFELAVVAGTTAVDGDTPEELLSYAQGLAREQTYDGELPPATALPDSAADRIASLSTGRVPADADG
ncbi:MAG: hypothetical protein ABEJ79_05550 [Halolamina sp.]